MAEKVAEKASRQRPPSWNEIKTRLKWIVAFQFIAAFVFILIVESVFLAIDYVSVVGFFVDTAILAGIAVLILGVSYYFLRKSAYDTYVAESRFSSMSDVASDAVVSFDMEFTVTAWSSGAARVFGYSKEEALGESVAIMLPEKVSDRDFDALETVAREGFVTGYRSARKRKSGEVFPVEVSASLLTGPDDEPYGIVSVIRDISERIDLDRKVKESEERYRDLYESIADGIVALSIDGRIVECNTAFAQMSGYAREELELLTYREITPPQWHAVDEDVFRNQIMKSGHSDEYQKEFIRKDGSYLPVAVRAWRVDDSDGKPSGTWAMLRDLSERKQYENFIRETIINLEQANERLRELDKGKTEFVGIVTHELRAPVAAMGGSINALRSVYNGEKDTETTELLNVLDRGVMRLSRLIDDLLDVTRIDFDQLKLRRKSVDASEPAVKVVGDFRKLFEEKGVTLKLETPDGTNMGLFDPDRVEQVLYNLVDNALKFTDSGDVTVKVRCTPARIAYSVTDTGPGIPTEMHQVIFDKFSSVNIPDGEERRGIGLGLSICKGIAEAHGGGIWVQSKVGSGSTFIFDIPRHEGSDSSAL